MAREIIIEQYDDDWVNQFLVTEDTLKTIFKNEIIDIQHIGSTAIPGLAAKPTIDVLVLVKDIDKIDRYNTDMQEHGFIAKGENEISGRRYFYKTELNDEYMHTHHIHVYQEDNPKYQEELLFRDYLRKNEEAKLQYAELKIRLAEKYRDNPIEYTNAKSEFCINIINKSRLYFRAIANNDLINDMKVYFESVPEVNKCTLYGSYREATYDQFSDIDIQLDVSGYDNSKFIREIPTLFNKRYDMLYYDYAPSLMPDKYVVSIAFNRNNPFDIVDIICTAEPHFITSREEYSNDNYYHLLKLWINNYKHYVRKTDYHNDITKMSNKIDLEDIGNKTDITLIQESFKWLKNNCPEDCKIKQLIAHCEYYCDKLL